MPYQPQHHNESIMIVDKLTGIAVMEIPGRMGLREELDRVINQERYRIQYAGGYLGELNQRIKNCP
jgi:hypothetical protein